MEITLDLRKIEERLTGIAQSSKKTWVPGPNNALNSSIRVSLSPDSETQFVTVSFKNYGLYLDAGVKGRFGGVTQAGYFGTKKEPYSFKRVPKKELKKAPYVGYGYGIAPRPWIKTMMEALTKEIVEFEKGYLPLQIKEKILKDLKDVDVIITVS